MGRSFGGATSAPTCGSLSGTVRRRRATVTTHAIRTGCAFMGAHCAVGPPMHSCRLQPSDCRREPAAVSYKSVRMLYCARARGSCKPRPPRCPRLRLVGPTNQRVRTTEQGASFEGALDADELAPNGAARLALPWARAYDHTQDA